MEIQPEKLMQIIGTKEVELILLRERIQQMALKIAELEKKKEKEKEKEVVKK